MPTVGALCSPPLCILQQAALSPSWSAHCGDAHADAQAGLRAAGLGVMMACRMHARCGQRDRIIESHA